MANKNTVRAKVPALSNIKVERNKQGTTIARLSVRKNTKIKVV